MKSDSKGKVVSDAMSNELNKQKMYLRSEKRVLDEAGALLPVVDKRMTARQAKIIRKLRKAALEILRRFPCDVYANLCLKKYVSILRWRTRFDGEYLIINNDEVKTKPIFNNVLRLKEDIDYHDILVCLLLWLFHAYSWLAEEKNIVPRCEIPEFVNRQRFLEVLGLAYQLGFEADINSSREFSLHILNKLFLTFLTSDSAVSENAAKQVGKTFRCESNGTTQ
jgi:hypothetical protein